MAVGSLRACREVGVVHGRRKGEAEDSRILRASRSAAQEDGHDGSFMCSGIYGARVLTWILFVTSAAP